MKIKTTMQQNKWFSALLLLCLTLASFVPVSVAQAAPATPLAGDEQWDEGFGFVGVEGDVVAIAVAANGDIYAGGQFQKAGGAEIKNVARWNGKSWQPLGAGVDGNVTALATIGNDVYVAGDFTTAGDLVANGIAKWNGTEWSLVGNGTGPINDYYGSPDPGEIFAMAVADNRLYIGGNFVSVDGVSANNIAVWDGTKWAALGTGIGKLDYEDKFVPDGEVLTIVPYGDALYVGGDFTQAGGITANNVAAWNGHSWQALGSGLTLENDNNGFTRSAVHALTIYNAKLVAGGIFNHTDGKTLSHLAIWDGTSWNSLGTGMQPERYSSDVVVTSLATVQNRLYAGGNFATAGGKVIDLIAQWDGTTWAEVGQGIADDGYDSVLVLTPKGNSLYIGGSYRIGGGLRVDNIAEWNGTAWKALGGGLIDSEYGDTPANPYAIEFDAAGRVFVGGEFEIAGGLKVKNFAMLDDAGWHNLGGTDGRVRAIAIDGDNIYIGGEFTKAGGISANHIARVNRATGQWSALGSGINGSVYALAFHNGILYAGGDFSAAGTAKANNVALWDGTTWHALGTQARIFERSQEGGEIGTYVNALAVAGDMVYIGGRFQTIQYGEDVFDLSSFVVVHNIVAWNQATDEWSYLGTPSERGVTNNGYSGFSEANALVLVGDNLYVGGKFNQAAGIAASNIARWNLAAGEWSALGDSIGGSDEPEVNDLALFGNNLFVVGKFTAVGAAEARFVAQYDTTTGIWSALGSGVSWYNDRFTAIYSVAASANAVYIGGDFTSAGGRAASGFARWNGTQARGNITPANGGKLNGGNGLTVDIPGGAANQELMGQVTQQPAPQQPLPAGKGNVRAFRTSATTLAGQAVTQLGKPYTVKVTYTDAQLAAAGITDVTTLNLLRWNGQAWTPMLPCTGCAVDTANKVVTVVTNQFSDFALAGNVTIVNPPPQGENLFLPMVRR